MTNADLIARPFGGVPIIFFTETALEETTERLFPESKNRSKRIHKKLVKRFGGEFRKRPAIFRIGDKIFAHPAHRARLLRALEDQRDDGRTD